MKTNTYMAGILTEFQTLVEIVERLRSPGGCSWDRAQTQKTLTRYAIEEAFELVEALDQGNQSAIQEEQGDFLFQAIIQSQVAKDEGHFDLQAVLQGINAKMIRRHPHVFQNPKSSDSTAHTLTAKEALLSFEKAKAKEKKESPSGNQPPPTTTEARETLAFPALIRALKIGLRSEKWKFDWETPEQVFAKVEEELAEVHEAIDSQDQHHIEEEMGDLLFAVSQWARHLQIDPEAALRKANSKFEKRFSHMVESSGLSLDSFRELSLQDKEALWQKTKKSLRID